MSQFNCIRFNKLNWRRIEETGYSSTSMILHLPNDDYDVVYDIYVKRYKELLLHHFRYARAEKVLLN